MIDVIDKNQMHESVITTNEKASEDWNCIILMFRTTFNDYFVFGYAYFMCICIKSLICFFGAWSVFLLKTGWQPWWVVDCAPRRFLYTRTRLHVWLPNVRKVINSC